MSQPNPTAPPANRATRDPNTVLRRAFDLDVRAASEDGVIEGYASVFNEVTSYGEIMAPGSFTRTLAAWKAKGRPVPVLWQHDSWQPIGVTTKIEEDDHGLRIEAELITDVQRAREALALAKRKAVSGLSIGFSLPALAADGQPSVVWDDELRVEVFREVRLWEYSMVTFPANDSAQIDEIRQHRAAIAELASTMRSLRDAIATDRAPERDAAALLRAARARILEQDQPRPARGPARDQRALTALIGEAHALLNRNA